MLISFTVTNFRSFHEEQTLSMVANTRIKGHEAHLRSIPDQTEKVLPATIFYGANGAGKSNLVRALALMQSLVVNGNRAGRGVHRDPFLLAAGTTKEATVLEIRILAGGHLLEYGFSINDEVILEEWLVRLVGKREEVIFERTTKGDAVTVDLSNNKGVEPLLGGNKMRAQAQVGALPNQLFVSTVGKSLPPTEQGVVFQCLRNWFEFALNIITPGACVASLPKFFRKNPEAQKFAVDFLANSSTGVSSLETVFTSVKLTKELEDLIRTDPSQADALIGNFRPDDSDLPGIEVLPDGTIGGHYLETEVGPDGHKVKLPLAEHSDGTRRLTHLLPALFVSRLEPVVYVIDEIDRSLHPLLARKYMEYFLAGSASHQSQLILTTHDTNLLDLELLRRDEIWFAEKNEAGATHLYSLAEFKVRTDLKIDSGYLNGRFGAIPFLGGLDRIFPQQPKDNVAPDKPVKADANH